MQDFDTAAANLASIRGTAKLIGSIPELDKRVKALAHLHAIIDLADESDDEIRRRMRDTAEVSYAHSNLARAGGLSSRGDWIGAALQRLDAVECQLNSVADTVEELRRTIRSS